ncbi:MAG: DUF4292 domain-containing protein [Bacteroidia bacterium]|nr:DUF4292 domain-containing protein [Bacteroidia bacterium]
MINSTQARPTNKFIPLLIAALLPLLWLGGCKNRGLKPAKGPAIKEINQLLALNQAENLDFKTWSAKGKGQYDGPDQSLGFSYKIVIAKDSIIWGSLTKFGYEGLRMLVDQDSIHLRVTDSKELITCDYRIISNMIGMQVDFQIMQSLIVGNTHFLPDSLQHDGSNKEAVKVSGKYGAANLEYFIDRSLHKLVKLNADDPLREAKTSAIWSEFQKLGDQVAAHSLSIQVEGKDQTHITFNHSEIELNGENPRFPFNVPDSYTRKGCPIQNGK